MLLSDKARCQEAFVKIPKKVEQLLHCFEWQNDSFRSVSGTYMSAELACTLA